MQSGTLEITMLDEGLVDHHNLHQGLRAFEECRWQDAIIAFRQVLEAEPSNIEVEGKLAFALSQAKQYDAAVEVLKRLCLKQPQIAKWPYMVGYQFYIQQSWKEALAWFTKALTLKPDYIVALYRTGYARLQSDQHDEGIKALQLCIEGWRRLSSDLQQTERKTYGKANFQLGKAYLGKGLSLKARRPLEIAVQMDGDDPNKRYELGKCLLKNGDVKGAIRELEKAHALKPGTDYVLDRLAQAYTAEGNPERAERTYQLIPSHRRRAFVLKNLGSVQLSLGKTDMALETLRLAAKKDPNSHNIQYLLLDFGHSPRDQVAGKWQPDEGLIAGVWEAAQFRDVYLPTRLHLFSGQDLPALGWSTKGRFLNGQSRVLGRTLETCGQRGSAKQAYMRAIDLRRQKYGLDFPEAQERLEEVSKTPMPSEALQQPSSNGKATGNLSLDIEEGVVDHYNSSRGFGFISSASQKVFFHITAVVDGYTPVVGEKVKFHVEQSEKGPKASRVMSA